MSKASNNGFVAAEVEVALGWNLAGSTFHIESDPPTGLRTINLANVVSIAPAKMA